jgi:hypothetical protein
MSIRVKGLIDIQSLNHWRVVQAIRHASAVSAGCQELSVEVSARLAAASVKARCVTLKVKRRQQGAPEPAKFLGHGVCDNISRSVTLAGFVSTAAEVCEQAAQLLHALAVPPEEIRGLGITVSHISFDHVITYDI